MLSLDAVRILVEKVDINEQYGKLEDYSGLEHVEKHYLMGGVFRKLERAVSFSHCML